MKSDVTFKGAIAPSKGADPSGPAASLLVAVRSRSVAELEQDLIALVGMAQPSRSLAELAPDGTPHIPSLVSVWLISQVGKAVGRPKLVNLSRVRREELRSIGGVARLIHRTLHPVPAGVKAS